MAEDQTVGEYRLSELEKKVDRLAEKIDDLPKRLDERDAKLDQRYATKAEMRDVRDDVTSMVEDQKTRKTATRAWMVPLVVAGVSIALSGVVAFVVYAVQTLNYVNTLRGQ